MTDLCTQFYVVVYICCYLSIWIVRNNCYQVQTCDLFYFKSFSATFDKITKDRQEKLPIHCTPALLTKGKRLDSAEWNVYSTSSRPHKQTNKHTTQAFIYNIKMSLWNVTKNRIKRENEFITFKILLSGKYNLKAKLDALARKLEVQIF